MGRPPSVSDGAVRQLSLKFGGRDHDALMNCAAREQTTMSEIVRRAVRAYILGSLNFYYVLTDKGIYIPPLSEPGFIKFSEARAVAARNAGQVVQRALVTAEEPAKEQV